MTADGAERPRFQAKRGLYTHRVRYADTDKAAVVHHAAYLSFLEAGRIELFRENGFDYAAFELATGTGMPVVDYTIKYRSPARFDDLLEVDTAIDEPARFTVWIAGTVRRGDTVLVTSRVRLACVDMRTEKPLRMPRALYDACLFPGYDV